MCVDDIQPTVMFTTQLNIYIMFIQGDCLEISRSKFCILINSTCIQDDGLCFQCKSKRCHQLWKLDVPTFFTSLTCFGLWLFV